MPLSENQLQLVESHLAEVKKKIVEAAESVTRKDGGPDIPQLGMIVANFARTKPIPTADRAWPQIIGVPGIIWITALLALTFGVLSIWYPGLADLAKVFAGAVVGASGARTKR